LRMVTPYVLSVNSNLQRYSKSTAITAWNAGKT
jgi:hypothetical protein